MSYIDVSFLRELVAFDTAAQQAAVAEGSMAEAEAATSAFLLETIENQNGLLVVGATTFDTADVQIILDQIDFAEQNALQTMLAENDPESVEGWISQATTLRSALNNMVFL